MSGLFNGGGGPVQSDFVPGDHIKFEYAALLNQIEPDGTENLDWANFDGSDDGYPLMNMRDILYDAMSFGGGNPFGGVSAIDPSDQLEVVNERSSDFMDEADDIDVRDFVSESIDSAIDIVDANLLSTSQIDELVNAMDTRTKARHLQAVSRATDGLNFSMAGMTSTVADTIAAMELDRSMEVNDFELKLVYADRQRRTEMVQFLTGNYLQTLGAKLDSMKAAFAMAMDATKINVAALQDQQDKDLEHATSEQLWDVTTIKHGFEALQVGSGMPMNPRAPTRAERAMQQITSSISFGAQTGAAFGPGAGYLAGGALLALNFLTNRATA